jgi:gliding motility-associated protein GldM
MAGGRCPETPRQKMIGMMYLFLTAMLAMNVSTMVLEAFRDIDNSLTSTLQTIEQKNRRVYAEIANKVTSGDSEYVVLGELASEIETRSNELILEIERIKLLIINHSSQAGYTDIGTAVSEVGKLDDLYAARDVLTEGYGEAGEPQGPILREKINDHKDFLLDILRDEKETPLYSSIEENLGTPQKINAEGHTYEWEAAISHYMPMMATIALLSKMQADVRNAEGDILNYLIMKIEGGVDIRITSMEGIVSAPKGFIVRGGGEKYTANIYLGARDTTQNPKVFLTTSRPYYDSIVNPESGVEYKLREGVTYTEIESTEGYAAYEADASSVGEVEYGGLIEFVTRSGVKYYPFTGNYTVGDAGFTVSATQCAVLYRGLDNPLAVSVAGYPKESVNVSVSGGASIRRAGNDYMVSVPQSAPNEINVTVSVRTAQGGRTLGSQKFRVFNVPPPTIYIAGAYRDGARIPRAAITQTPRLSARLESDFFPFEGITYSIASYEFLYQARGVAMTASGSGSNLSGDVMTQIGRMGAGSSLTFTGMQVDGPSGRIRTQGLTVILQ